MEAQSLDTLRAKGSIDAQEQLLNFLLKWTLNVSRYFVYNQMIKLLYVVYINLFRVLYYAYSLDRTIFTEESARGEIHLRNLTC